MTSFSDVAGDRSTLASITGDVADFLGRAWARTPWFSAAQPIPGDFGLDDVDRIVASSIRTPAIRMVRHGVKVPPADFCSPTRIGSVTLSDVADARKVLDQYRRGATLVLQSLHRSWLPLSEWCSRLERELGWPVQANAYLTPASCRGLDRHDDGHDVFAVQVHGSKWWDVDGIGVRGLTAGDVLYVPAGTDHEAWTEDEPSLHLTLGVHRPTVERIASRLASRAIAGHAKHAKSAPSPSHEEPSDQIHAIAGLIRERLAEVDADELLEGLRRRPRAYDGGLLASCVRRSVLTLDDAIAPSPGGLSVDVGDHRAIVEWRHGVLALPRRSEPALRHLASSERPIRIGDLPGIDDDERLLIARRLLDEAAAQHVT